MTPSETPEQLQSRIGKFITALERLESNDAGSDRATMAALRAGLRHTNGVAMEMMPFVSKHLPERESPTDERWFQIAALFALHPQNTRSETFAQAFRRLAADGSDSIEKRFQVLLSCRSEDFFRQMLQCVSLLHANNLPMNWFRLLHDLTRYDWDDVRRPLQLRWAREFYRAPLEKDSEN